MKRKLHQKRKGGKEDQRSERGKDDKEKNEEMLNWGKDGLVLFWISV